MGFRIYPLPWKENQCLQSFFFLKSSLPHNYRNFRNKQLFRQIFDTIKDMDGSKWKILNKEVKVNQFFLNAVKLLLPSIKNELNDPSKRYIVTGHSLGGAMASLLAIMMVEDGNVSLLFGLRIIFKCLLLSPE